MARGGGNRTEIEVTNSGRVGGLVLFFMNDFASRDVVQLEMKHNLHFDTSAIELFIHKFKVFAV